jgi:hypothetical protein
MLARRDLAGQAPVVRAIGRPLSPYAVVTMRAPPQPHPPRPHNGTPWQAPAAPMPERWFEDTAPLWQGAEASDGEAQPAEPDEATDLPGLDVEELSSQSLFQQFFGAWPR